jgi:head-tail adaptor
MARISPLNEIHKIGHMDRIIEIFQVGETRSDSGAVIRNQVSLGTHWAKVEYVVGSAGGSKEADEGGKLTEFQMLTFIIRKIAGITPKNYIRFDGEDYDIKGINEEGRNRFQKIIAQRRS